MTKRGVRGVGAVAALAIPVGVLALVGVRCVRAPAPRVPGAVTPSTSPAPSPAAASPPSVAAGGPVSPEGAPEATPRATAGVGVCRAFGGVDGLDAKGRRVAAAVSGELRGEALGPEATYREALVACVADPRCDGITTTWYVGSPWTPLRAAAPFRPDESSYACTVTVGEGP